MTEQPSTEMTAMSHETTGFCFCGQMHGPVKDWNEHDWAALRTHAPAGALSAQPVSLPTREQIAKVLYHRRHPYPMWEELGVDQNRWLLDADAVRALLSQPTPTAESVSPLCLFGHDVFTAGGYCRRCGASMLPAAEPPRIEDLAPGTTFRASLLSGFDATCKMRLWFVSRTDALGTRVSSSDGERWTGKAIDPSTIRDVTPPKGDDR